MIDRFFLTQERERRISGVYVNITKKKVRILPRAHLSLTTSLPTSERKTDGRMNDRRYRMKQGSQSIGIAVEIVSSGWIGQWFFFFPFSFFSFILIIIFLSFIFLLLYYYYELLLFIVLFAIRVCVTSFSKRETGG